MGLAGFSTAQGSSIIVGSEFSKPLVIGHLTSARSGKCELATNLILEGRSWGTIVGLNNYQYYFGGYLLQI